MTERNPMSLDIEEYFSGRRLYGDDFSDAQLFEWYEGEKEGYAGSVLANSGEYRYHYHELNRFHFFDRISIAPGSAALGLGSALSTPSLQVRPPSRDSVRTIHPSGRPS